jgi:hypothetical protein
VDPRVDLDNVGKRESSCLYRESNGGRPALILSLCRLNRQTNLTNVQLMTEWLRIFCFWQILVGFRQECVGNQCSASCFTGSNTRTCDGFENKICRLIAILFTFATSCCFPLYLLVSVTVGDCDRTAVSISQMSLAIH